MRSPAAAHAPRCRSSLTLTRRLYCVGRRQLRCLPMCMHLRSTPIQARSSILHLPLPTGRQLSRIPLSPPQSLRQSMREGRLPPQFDAPINKEDSSAPLWPSPRAFSTHDNDDVNPFDWNGNTPDSRAMRLDGMNTAATAARGLDSATGGLQSMGLKPNRNIVSPLPSGAPSTKSGLLRMQMMESEQCQVLRFDVVSDPRADEAAHDPSPHFFFICDGGLATVAQCLVCSRSISLDDCLNAATSAKAVVEHFRAEHYQINVDPASCKANSTKLMGSNESAPWRTIVLASDSDIIANWLIPKLTRKLSSTYTTNIST